MMSGRRALLLIAWTIALVPGLAWAGDSCPVVQVPEDRWGMLEPRAILHDGSCWNFGSVPNENDPYFFAVDVENGWVFAAAGKGIAILDARTNPGNPAPTGPYAGYKYAPPLVPVWFQSDQKFYIWDIDAPEDDDTIVATASSGNGLIVWDTSDKVAPSVHYQDAPAGETSQVVVLEIGGRQYAFTAAGSAAKVYDLTAAKELSGCLDSTVSGTTPCPGVYLGTFGANPVAGIGGTDHYVVINRINAGFEIWDVSDPSDPVMVMTSAAREGGLEMWRDADGAYWLAAARGTLRFFDVSEIGTPACHETPCVLPSASSTFAPAAFLGRLTVGRDGDSRRLWSSDGSTGAGPQLDFVLDVGDPTRLRELTPQTHPDGYWGWYYQFEWVNPGLAAWWDHHLYRVAFGLFDVHEQIGIFSDGFESGDLSAWSTSGPE